jgi:L-galactonate dehydratase
MFKQLLQAGSIDICQIDACRLGGVNEVMSVLLMAKKYGNPGQLYNLVVANFSRFNTPVIPHSGGIGLNEYTQHLAIIDYVCVSGKKSMLEHINSFNQVIEYPVKVKDSYFVTPWEQGYSVKYKNDAITRYSFPNGVFWKSDQGLNIRHGQRI